MNNADRFKQIFGLYATELWAMSEKDFLAWLNAERDVPDTNVGDLISRQAAIEHLKKRLYETALNNVTELPYYEEMADNRVDVWMNELPTITPKYCQLCEDGDEYTPCGICLKEEDDGET